MIIPGRVVGSGYMSNVNVASKLRGKPTLNWDTRKRITIDTTWGLLYLQEQ